MDNLNNPFLRGWNTSEVLSNQRGAHQLAALSGLMQLQAGMENVQLTPLRRQLLETELANAQRNNEFRQRLFGGPTNAPQLAFGEGGVSLPGGAQGNVNTGQVVQGAPQQGMGGIDPQVAYMLMSGDPGLKALGSAILEQNKPVPMSEGGAIFRNGQIVASRPKLGENVLPVTDAQGNVTGVRPMPGSTGVISDVVRAQEGPKMGEFQIGGRTYKMPNEDYAAITGPDAFKAVQTATRYGIPLSRDAGPQGAPQLQGTPPVPAGGGIGTIPTSRLFGSSTNAERVAEETTARAGAEAQARRDFNMGGIGEVISEAEKILKSGKPTSSYFGATQDFTGRVLGISVPGSKEAGQLEAIGGALVARMPRMEGPQSDRDVIMYREMAGKIGDRTVPLADRLAALDTLKTLWVKYDKNVAQTPGSSSVPGSGGWSIRPVQ